MMTSTIARIAIAVALLGLLGSPARAGIVVFSATDVGAGPADPRPNSDAAAASFDAAAAALGPVSRITFESAPLGSFTNLTVAPGVSIAGTDYLGNNQTIRNVPSLPGNPALDGFNTTPGGSHYVEVIGGTLTFSFATPTQFFGAYFTGVQPVFFNDVITFSDGSAESVSITNPSSNLGGVTFVGFTDAGKSIVGVTVSAGTVSLGADFIGVDDVRYQGATAVPEPASVVLGGVAAAAGACGWLARRRRHRGNA